MSLHAEIQRHRKSFAESALAIARELEAGRASAPLQAQLGSLLREQAPPVRVALLSATNEALHHVLPDIIGHDYNVCKVMLPSRLGYSEVLLRERGYLLDTGSGAREFDDAESFVAALHQANTLPAPPGASADDQLRVQLSAPSHLCGLCLLVPHSLAALHSKPALLSTLADQADWIILIGEPTTRFADEQRATIQLLLDHVGGLQNLLVTPGQPQPPASEWWKGWRATLSLGLVAHPSELFRSRLALLNSPDSELRLFLVERRLLRQAELLAALLDDEIQQSQRQLSNRLNLSREGLISPASTTDLRQAAESIRTRLDDELGSILRTLERDAKAALAPEGPAHLRLRDIATSLTVDDIERTVQENTIKLSVAPETRARLTAELLDLARQRLAADLGQLREGFECSVRDAERLLESACGARHKLALDLPEEPTLWQTCSALARPEIRYRGEMPRPTFLTRLAAARQGIMSLMIAGTILGGAAALTGGESGGQSLRTVLYALMLPLLIVGFLWTYVSFRRRERTLLEKEVEKLHDGVLQELRRVLQELTREQHSALATAFQKNLRSTLQQVDSAIERSESERQREADEIRRRHATQQRTVEQRLARLRELSRSLATLQSRFADTRATLHRWLADWIARFNQQPAA